MTEVPSIADNRDRGLDAFFKPHRSTSLPGAISNKPRVTSSGTNSSPVDPLKKLSSLLKLPDSQKLTRSERLFSLATKTDVRSMSIRDDGEFYLFMDMRAENLWASFNMTSCKWVTATQDYNTRLEALNVGRNRPTIKKNPRALLELLGEIEARIISSVGSLPFMFKTTFNHATTATRSNTDVFWKKHCAAVPLVKVEHPNTTVLSGVSARLVCLPLRKCSLLRVILVTSAR